MVARLCEDGESLAIKIDFLERDVLMEADPEAFYITDHSLNYPMMLVRLPSVGRDLLREILEQAWRRPSASWLPSTTRGDAVAGFTGSSRGLEELDDASRQPHPALLQEAQPGECRGKR